LTVTLPLLNAAEHVLFLVAGADKAAPLGAVLSAVSTSEAQTDELLPAARVRPTSRNVEWLVDATAAVLLPPRLRFGLGDHVEQSSNEGKE
jgi:6-phosphogluconolactonase